MSFHHLDAPEYQGPGVTQLHDTAIEAELVTAPERAVPDDVLHYNQQLELDDIKRKKQQQQRLRGHDSSDEEEEAEEDEQLMQRMRDQLLSKLKQQNDDLVATASTLQDITEDDFAHHCLTSSHAHLTLLLLHCHTPACLHLAQVLATLGRRYPAALRCAVRLRATGDNIAHFPLSACPTVMAYQRGKKVGQWGVGDWKRRGARAGGSGGGGSVQGVEVYDVIAELRRCGLLDAEEDEGEEVEDDGRSGRLRITRGSGRAESRHHDSSDDDG